MTSQFGQVSGNSAALMQAVKVKFMVIRLIHLALLVGSLMFGGVMIVISHKQLTTKVTPDPMLIVAGAMCIASLAGSLVVRQLLKKGGVVPADPNSILIKYQTICLVQWALIEGAALFSAVVTLLTKNTLAAVFFVICIAFLAFRRPSEQEFLTLFANRP